MNETPACLRLRLSAAFLALTGCSGAVAGGQTGEETEGECVYAVSPLGADEESGLGFTARESSALAVGEHRAAFEWIASPSTPYGPESGASEIALRATAAKGHAEFWAARDATSVVGCHDFVRVPIDVELDTAGGAFAEAFPAKLDATTREQAEFSHLLSMRPKSTLRGSFAFVPGALGEEQLNRFQLAVRFDTRGWSGELAAHVTRETGGSADGATSLRIVPLACWGARTAGPSSFCAR